MRYIGNKKNLLEFIYSVVIENKLPVATFCDIFAGTANVAKFFKSKGFEIISNDIMTYSYVFSRAYICNNKMPSFSGLSNEIKEPDIFKVITFLNNQEGKKGFIYENYCSDGTRDKKFIRNYFSKENAMKIDSIREKIQNWKDNRKITENEFYILLCALLEVIPSVSNISGTYGAFLKINDPRMFKPLLLEVPTLVESYSEHECYQEDANKLIKEISPSILYLDPPYNERQYASNYHILESVAIWDKQISDSKTGLRPYEDKKSDYCYKNKCITAFEELINNARCEFILMSYNTEGIIPQNEIMRILSKKGKVTIYHQDYRRYKSNSNGDLLKENLKELLFFVRITN
ncbi:MAG: DNA adenine methylase [Candidatus Pacearchaeota archaeon]